MHLTVATHVNQLTPYYGKLINMLWDLYPCRVSWDRVIMHAPDRFVLGIKDEELVMLAYISDDHVGRKALNWQGVVCPGAGGKEAIENSIAALKLGVLRNTGKGKRYYMASVEKKNKPSRFFVRALGFYPVSQDAERINYKLKFSDIA
jgi:hypothetical protein